MTLPTAIAMTDQMIRRRSSARWSTSGMTPPTDAAGAGWSTPCGSPADRGSAVIDARSGAGGSRRAPAYAAGGVVSPSVETGLAGEPWRVFGAASPDSAFGAAGSLAGAGAEDVAAGAAEPAGFVAASMFVASAMSVAAFRNSRTLLPRDWATSGSRPGPSTTRAMIRMMISSGAPMLNGLSNLR